MDAQLKSQTHIAKVCGIAYATLKNIARIQNLLTPEGAKTIIQGLVISQLDYCNGILLGVSVYQLSKLQIAQIVLQNNQESKEIGHISDAMKDLHLLKIPQDI